MFLGDILEYLYTGFQIILDFLQSVLRFLEQIPHIMEFFTTLTIYVPTWALGFIVFSISMSVVLLIAGRK